VEPILDELSLVPCPVWSPAKRVETLARTLKALDSLGAARVLRSVTDAVNRDIAQGRGLKDWCFDPQTQAENREAGLFLAARLAKQPFIDGPVGLFAKAEGPRALETRTADGGLVYGLGLAALEDGFLTVLGSASKAQGEVVQVQIVDCSEDELQTSTVRVNCYVLEQDVCSDQNAIQEKINQSLGNGSTLVTRLVEVFPNLIIGPEALSAFKALTGTEPVFGQLKRHLHALNKAVSIWQEGAAFEPQLQIQGVTFSPESAQTLTHSKFGAMRHFSTPNGFTHEQWSWHTKLKGGTGARLYFRAVKTGNVKQVLIGYFGAHLPCVRYPT
jgi:hypothetical protein